MAASKNQEATEKVQSYIDGARRHPLRIGPVTGQGEGRYSLLINRPLRDIEYRNMLARLREKRLAEAEKSGEVVEDLETR